MKLFKSKDVKRFIKDSTWGHDEISKWAIIPAFILIGLIFWRMSYYGSREGSEQDGFKLTLELWTLIILFILICKRNFKIK